jgi:hypothetical protein
MGTSGLFFQFMSVPGDFLTVIRSLSRPFEHKSLPIDQFKARCAQSPENPAIVFKMPPAQ